MKNSMNKIIVSALITGLLAGSAALANDEHHDAGGKHKHKAHGHKKCCKDKAHDKAKDGCDGKDGCEGKKEHHDAEEHHEGHHDDAK